jgi:hypothetical protein
MIRGMRDARDRRLVPPSVMVGLSALLILTIAALAVLPSWLLPGPANEFDSATRDLEGARNALRGTILQTAGAVLVVVGALATWSGIRIARRQQVNDQFVRAVELLTRTRLDGGGERPIYAAHIGAVHTLERIMRTEVSYQPAIVAVLSAYIRQHSPAPATDDLDRRPEMARNLGYRQPSVWWALDALMRRVPRADDPAIDLSATDLRYSTVNLSHLSHAHLEDADLRGCELTGTADQITANGRTRWPDSFDPRAAGVLLRGPATETEPVEY